MVWYLLNILIITFVWLWPVNVITTGKDVLERNYKSFIIRKKRVCIVATLNWIILSGLRDLSVGADTLAYKIHGFDRIVTMSWTEIFYKLYLKYIDGVSIKDPGYPLLEKIFQIFSTNYQIFLIFIAIIFFVPMGILIYKYSENPYLSYIIFSTLFYSFFAITGHRQTIATSMVVFGGIELIKKRKLIKFLILVAIASTIHASVVCFLPFYWLSKIKINKFILMLYWAMIGSSFIFKIKIMSFLQEIVGYEQYGVSEKAGIGMFIILLLFLCIFVTIFYRNFLEKKHKEGQNYALKETAINALFIAAFFSSLVTLNTSFMRVVQYYSIFIMFLLPQCKYVFVKKNRVFFETVCCIVMITLLIKNNPEYIFFWQ